MDKILIIGSEGSMGRRYQSILKYLKVDFGCYDIKIMGSYPDFNKYDAFIVCTPTFDHEVTLLSLQKYNKPILCDKPIIKDSQKVAEILSGDIDLDIMFQYRELLNDIYNWMDEPFSSYNYFRTGNDGLYWDCMQTIGLHRGSIDHLSIRNDSPVWECKINNEQLHLGMMDIAYVKYLSKWLKGHRTPKEEIINYHWKVEEFIKCQLPLPKGRSL